jgi:hypothetical protein
MTGSSVAGIITAVATGLTALGGVIATLAVLIPILRGTREIHKIVNQQRTDMENFQRALIRALIDAGVPVPVDQSLPKTPPL